MVYNVEMFDQKLSYQLIDCYEAFKQLNEMPENSVPEVKWYPLPALLRQKYYRYVVELSKEIEVAKGFLTPNGLFNAIPAV